jgi:hypothetical protein
LLGAQISVEHWPIYDSVRVAIRGFLWGENAAEEAVTYPADWWQAFKERWFPKLLLAFWPVRYTTVIMNADVVYPDFKPAMPERNPVLVVNKWTVPED